MNCLSDANFTPGNIRLMTCREEQTDTLECVYIVIKHSVGEKEQKKKELNPIKREKAVKIKR